MSRRWTFIEVIIHVPSLHKDNSLSPPSSTSLIMQQLFSTRPFNVNGENIHNSVMLDVKQASIKSSGFAHIFLSIMLV